MTGKFTTPGPEPVLNRAGKQSNLQLSDDERSLLERLCQFLAETAREFGVPDTKQTSFEMFDPEGGPDQVVVAQILPVDADTALAYWEFEARQFELWRAALSKGDKQFLDNRVAVNIQWTVDG